MKTLFVTLLILCSSYSFAQTSWKEKYPVIDMNKFDWSAVQRFPSSPEAGTTYTGIGFITTCPISRDENGTVVPFTTSYYNLRFLQVYIMTDKGMVRVSAKGTGISHNLDIQEAQFVKNQIGKFEPVGKGYIMHYSQPMAVHVSMIAGDSQVEYEFSPM